LAALVRPERVIDVDLFRNVRLQGGFTIARIAITEEPLVDAIGREAIARTRVRGRNFDLLIRAGLSRRELSVTLYHEILGGRDGSRLTMHLMQFKTSTRRI